VERKGGETDLETLRRAAARLRERRRRLAGPCGAEVGGRSVGCEEGADGAWCVLCSDGSLASATTWVSRLFDRSDATIRARQDMAINLAVFALACYAVHKYGYKLAV
jgi:hypothetical protein